MGTAKTIAFCMTPYSELVQALPPKWQNITKREKLLAAYRHELHCFLNVALRPDCQELRFVMLPWRREQEPEQWTCDFWVADTALPCTSGAIWHGHDTSQWRHGGAIWIFQDQIGTSYWSP